MNSQADIDRRDNIQRRADRSGMWLMLSIRDRHLIDVGPL